MNLIRHLFTPKMLMPAIAVVATALVGYGIVNQKPATAASCQTNDVVFCGYKTPAELADKVAGNSELQTIYNNQFTPGYGIGDLNNWKANAKHATVFKDGRVVLDDGTLVATNANSLGREKFNGNREPIVIGGKTYFFGTTQNNFAINSIPAYVLLNDDHSLKFAALTECGNPVWATSPSYKCNMLNQKKISDSTYEYTTDVTNPGALTKLVYDFGDGQSKTVTSDFSQAVQHTYAPGSYTAKVTAFFSINSQEKSDARAECTKPVEVPQPPKKVFVCKSLTAAPVTGSTTKFTFTITGESTNANLVSGAIFFGDNQSASDIKPATEQTVVVPHEYAQPGTYKATAVLTYDAGTTVDTCETQVTVPQPPTTPPTPQPPHVLPSTGPVEIISSAVGLGTAAGATLYYRGSRRNFIAEALKRR